MLNWIWEPTKYGFIHRDDELAIDVEFYDDGQWVWTNYGPTGSTDSACGFATADEAKADAERFFSEVDAEV